VLAGWVKAELVVKSGNPIHLAGRDGQMLCDHLHGSPGEVGMLLLDRLEYGNEVSSGLIEMRQHGRYLFDHCSLFAIQFGSYHVYENHHPPIIMSLLFLKKISKTGSKLRLNLVD
jgi:hypothetical protein